MAKKRKDKAKRKDREANEAASAGDVAVLESVESAAAYIGGPQVVDRNGWRSDADGFSDIVTVDPRDDGRNRPFIENEWDLWEVQSIARIILEVNPYAQSVIGNLDNYVIGTGFKYVASSKKKRAAPEGLIGTVQDVIDDFLDANDWAGDLESEMFRRSRRDGEYFLRLHPDRDCVARLRAIEPEYVRTPSNPREIEEYAERQFPHACNWAQPFSWTFGVHTPEGDTVDSLGYFVDWSRGGADCEYVPAYEIEHVKCNVDRNIKRGMSDFFPSRKWLDKALKLLGGTVSGATVQSNIALFKKMEAGVSGEKVASAQAAAASFIKQVPTASGGVTSRDITRIDEGTVITSPAGRSYEPGPMGQNNAPVYIEVLQAALRAIAARWSMPEHMISSDASNNNYASILESGSPFRKSIDKAQAFYVKRFGRMVWKALRIAFNQGWFNRFGMTWRQFEYLIDVQIEAPIPEVTNRTEETNRRSTLHDKGLLSKKTWSAQEGLDHDLEVANGAKPVETGLPGITDPGEDGGDERPPAAYKDTSRLQFRRNRSSIRQLLDELIAGKSTEAETRVLLRSLGLSDADVDQLVTSAADGDVGDEEIDAARESLATDMRRAIVQEAVEQIWSSYP